MDDRPRLFKNPIEIRKREEKIFSTRVAPLNNWVLELRERLGSDAIVPWFDPEDGGTEAQILWLLQAPGPKATRERGGSGFISCNNNDGTAQNTWETREEGGVSREIVIHWNVIPYYIGSSRKIRAYDPNDIAAVGPLITEQLDLLPKLQVVILGGTAASKVWHGYAPQQSQLRIIECPHPSPMNVNTRPENREKIISAWEEALRLVDH